jgi:leucine dehydrogenase
VKVVAGGANNQLRDEARHGSMLATRGIFYAPDFVLNAGGVIAAAQEVARFDDEVADAHALQAAALDRTHVIASILDEIVELADAESITTHAAAVKLAKARIQATRGND